MAATDSFRPRIFGISCSMSVVLPLSDGPTKAITRGSLRMSTIVHVVRSKADDGRDLEENTAPVRVLKLLPLLLFVAAVASAEEEKLSIAIEPLGDTDQGVVVRLTFRFSIPEQIPGGVPLV